MNNNMEDIQANDLCTGYDRNSIHQIQKKDLDTNPTTKYNIFPLTYIQAVYDARDGRRLDTILEQCNNLYVYWKGSREATRLQLPMYMRRRGIIITYRDGDNNIVTEQCVNADRIADDVFGKDENWELISYRDLTEEDLRNVNKYGFNVTVFGMKGGTHTLESAIKDVPYDSRILGQKITFAQNGADWVTYQFQQLSLDGYENPSNWKQLEGIYRINGGLDITNQPDEEDITSDGNNLLKFADKEYSEEAFSGLGRVYLRKNIQTVNYNDGTIAALPVSEILETAPSDLTDSIAPEGDSFEIGISKDGKAWAAVYDADLCTRYLQWNATGEFPADSSYVDSSDVLLEGSYSLNGIVYDWNGTNLVEHQFEQKAINLLTQSMIGKSDTRYIVQYDYDLNGTAITIPEGCILEFQGGSLNNGKLNGSNTTIRNTITRIFNDINISGSWMQDSVYSDWFDFSLESKYDNIVNFSNLFTLATSDAFTDVYINGKELYTSTNIPVEGSNVAKRGIKIPSNVYIHNNAIIKAIENSEERYSIFYVNDVENVTIDGGELIGDVQTHTGDTGEWGYGIALGGARNVVIKNIIISECWGDGINVQALYSDYENKTTEGHCRNILIDNVKCLRNRRQGISIEGCFGITVRNSEFSDTGSIKSTAPGAGIDIEPWFEEEVVTDVLIENCKLLNNQTYLQIYGKNDLKGVRVINCTSDKGIWIRTNNVTIDNWVCTGENYQAYLAIWGTCKNIKVTNSIFYNEIYCRGDIQDTLISNCEFNMKFTEPWSGFALCFENYNSTGIYKNITISNNRFSDVYKSRFFYADSDDTMKIDFIGNDVVSTATFAQTIGFGDFIGNSIFFKNCPGIKLDNKTGATVNVTDNNIYCDVYTTCILEFKGNSIHSDDVEYDYKMYNNTITSENSFRVFGGESISNLYVDISNCNFGRDAFSENYRATNVKFNSGYELTSYFSKNITPVIYNSLTDNCYELIIPFKRGFVEIMTSNLNVSNEELFNTNTIINLNPGTSSVEICPTELYRTYVRVDSTSMNFVPEFGTKVDEDKIHIYIKHSENITFGLRVTATVNIQEKIEYSDIKFNSVPIPADDVIFYKKVDVISYSSTTKLSYNITPYLGWKLWNPNDRELAFNGSEWLNSDGTLADKVIII